MKDYVIPTPTLHAVLFIVLQLLIIFICIGYAIFPVVFFLQMLVAMR